MMSVVPGQQPDLKTYIQDADGELTPIVAEWTQAKGT
jgi:hypothetical protein